MNHSGKLIALLPAVALAACATTSADEPGAPDTGPGAVCDAAPAQSFVGQKATAEIGAEIMDATGAQRLRWGPPNTAFTMDFRQDRVNVMYDDAMIITDVTCG